MDVTVHTKTVHYKEPRNVTLWLEKDGAVRLLGSLPHGTIIVIDQRLVDELQALVNHLKGSAT